VVDVIYLDTANNATIKNDVIFKTCHAPGTGTAESRIPKPPQPAKTGIGGKRFGRLAGRFEDACRWIVAKKLRASIME
jgi:hypothetical protein